MTAAPIRPAAVYMRFADDGAPLIRQWDLKPFDGATAFVRERSFQSAVAEWMLACFGKEIATDRLERGDRFIEEALELAQTVPGFSADRAHALVDYVFARPMGGRGQEVGGVMLTLAALCNSFGLRIDAEADAELARVWTKIEAIRAKQAAKPTGSALPCAPQEDDAKWLWWAGTADAVNDDAIYDLGSFATRDAAIAAAIRDTMPGDRSYIVEALTGDREEDRDEDDRIPFLSTRNAECIIARAPE